MSVFIFFQFQMTKKEREICAFKMNLRNLFPCCFNLSNGDIYKFLKARSEKRHGFEMPSL